MRAWAIATVALAAGAPAATAQMHYRSTIQNVAPQVAGLTVDSLSPVGHLRLVDRTGRTVVVYGYEREPFARVLADGRVQLNQHAPTVYLNRRAYGGVKVPAGVSASAPPDWRTVASNATLDWRDHRAQWTSPGLPPQVRDRSRETLIFAWTVPIAVGTQQGAIYGRLTWEPATKTGIRASSGVGATAAIAIGAAIVVALGVLALLGWRRRR